MKKLLPIVVAAIAVYVAFAPHQPPSSMMPVAAFAPPAAEAPAADSGKNGSVLASAFDNHASNVRVEGRGRVSRVLPDDNEGSRHQRFLVRLESGQTILIAHNIDLASRVDALGEGDAVEFSGEYEWNPRGGVVHWTHRDPAGRHAAGWLRHNGQTYQ